MSNRNNVGAFFTKLLQGSLFRKFRDVVLGYEHINTLIIVPPQERVGNGVLEKNEICDEKVIFKAQNGKEKKNIGYPMDKSI